MLLLQSQDVYLGLSDALCTAYEGARDEYISHARHTVRRHRQNRIVTCCEENTRSTLTQKSRSKKCKTNDEMSLIPGASRLERSSTGSRPSSRVQRKIRIGSRMIDVGAPGCKVASSFRARHHAKTRAILTTCHGRNAVSARPVLRPALL